MNNVNTAEEKKSNTPLGGVARPKNDLGDDQLIKKNVGIAKDSATKKITSMSAI